MAYFIRRHHATGISIEGPHTLDECRAYFRDEMEYYRGQIAVIVRADDKDAAKDTDEVVEAAGD